MCPIQIFGSLKDLLVIQVEWNINRFNNSNVEIKGIHIFHMYCTVHRVLKTHYRFTIHSVLLFRAAIPSCASNAVDTCRSLNVWLIIRFAHTK